MPYHRPNFSPADDGSRPFNNYTLHAQGFPTFACSLQVGIRGNNALDVSGVAGSPPFVQTSHAPRAASPGDFGGHGMQMRNGNAYSSEALTRDFGYEETVFQQVRTARLVLCTDRLRDFMVHSSLNGQVI